MARRRPLLAALLFLAPCASAARATASEPPVEPTEPTPVEQPPIEQPPIEQPPVALPRDPEAEQAAEHLEDLLLRDDDDKRWVLLDVELALGGRLGGSIGNVLAVPFAVPGPGVTIDLASEVELFRAVFLGSSAGLSLGQSERPGDLPLAGYGALLFAGARGDLQWAKGEADVHVGLTSLALVPIPRAGLGLQGSVLPVREDWFEWDITARTDLDVLLVAPAPGASLSTGVRFNVGDAWTELRLGAGGNAVVAVLFNSLSGAVSLSLRGGYTFD